MFILALFLSIAPAFTYLFILRSMDKYDKEPLQHYMMAFLWGAIGAVLLVLFTHEFVFDIFQRIEGILGLSIIDYFGENFEAVILAPLLEESFKAIFLIFLFYNKVFDNLTDGLVYGGAIGLGFGMTENFGYLLDVDTLGELISLAFIRNVFTILLHAVATGCVGAFLGEYKFKKKGTLGRAIAKGLLPAILIHFFWNYSVVSTYFVALGIVMLLGVVIAFIIIMKKSIESESTMILNQLHEEAANGLIPFEHVSRLSSSLRKEKYWIKEEIRNLYIETATTLAFRKGQQENADLYDKKVLEFEIEQLREKIRKILRYAYPGEYKQPVIEQQPEENTKSEDSKSE
ncbi:MAG: PrsW family intramembrane metalloprotease [Ignavibacteriaceae bacterium]|nr:PrsW family intramembrane metalloprotease [Ignavibacteriaceae bacterium]